jgi:hypothetical protein
LYTLSLAHSMSSSTNECSITQSNWTLIGCPYLAIVIEYLVEIIFFFLSIDTTTHSKKCDSPLMFPCKQMCPGVNLSYVAKQNEKNVISIG